jgi:hypothetical protein
MRNDVNVWIDLEDSANVIVGVNLHAVTIAPRPFARGVDLYFPEGTPMHAVEAVAAAINLALSGAYAAQPQKEPADV